MKFYCEGMVYSLFTLFHVGSIETQCFVSLLDCFEQKTHRAEAVIA